MPGDYSRKLFDRKKHYSAVLEQQGRVQLDADWNEQVDLQQYYNQTTSADLIGKSGVPKKDVGFAISINANRSDLLIAPGRIYAGGLLFECEAGNSVSYLNQPHYKSPDTAMFADSPAASLKDGNYIAYLEAWQRERSYLDDPDIQEVALGEADTTTRLQNIWQVKLLSVNQPGSLNCKTDIGDWNNLIKAPTGQLNVQTVEDSVDTKPCLLPAKGGYSSLENQLYRIQIIRGGTQANATYAWSRDNASVETAILEVSGSTLTVADMGKDEILGFSGGQWVEIVEAEPSPATPVLFEIMEIKPGLKQIVLGASANQFQGKSGLKLRRWDISGTGVENGIPLPTAWTPIENGIQVMFSAGLYRPGDYWQIPARTATADIEWPKDNAQNSLPQLPQGINRYFVRLAIITVTNGNATVKDCRPRFPALTEICAEDICYSSRGCTNSTATNVQEALDELCHKRDGACTYMAFPGAGWEKVFEKIEPGKDAQICFQVGAYPLTEPVIIRNKGHLKLSGAGTGTRIVATGTEAALIFEQCQSVTIRDLHASTDSFISRPAKNTKHLNGVITCVDCTKVNLSDLDLQCGAAAKEQVTCITLRNKAEAPGAVTIQDCTLRTGHYQQGMLLVNAGNAMIRNNRLSTQGSSDTLKKEALLSDKLYLSTARAALVAKANTKGIKDGNGMSVVTLSASGQTVSFLSTSTLKNDWSRLLAQNPGSNIHSSTDLLAHVKKLADKVLLNKDFAETIASFRALRRAILVQTQAVATSGITIGGSIARNIKILDNTIEGALAAIHVGLSHHANRNIHDRAQSVTIAGNSIQIILPRDAGRIERHGIFAGNTRMLSIDNNQILIQRLSGAEKIPVEGIKVWGVFGERMMISNNIISSVDELKKNSFSTGILVHPLGTKTGFQQWLVMNNVLISQGIPLRISGGVVSTGNTP